MVQPCSGYLFYRSVHPCNTLLNQLQCVKLRSGLSVCCVCFGLVEEPSGRVYGRVVQHFAFLVCNTGGENRNRGCRLAANMASVTFMANECLMKSIADFKFHCSLGTPSPGPEGFRFSWLGSGRGYELTQKTASCGSSARCASGSRDESQKEFESSDFCR